MALMASNTGKGEFELGNQKWILMSLKMRPRQDVRGAKAAREWSWWATVGSWNQVSQVEGEPGGRGARWKESQVEVD